VENELLKKQQNKEKYDRGKESAADADPSTLS
jgi:hypothetical protein